MAEEIDIDACLVTKMCHSEIPDIHQHRQFDDDNCIAFSSLSNASPIHQYPLNNRGEKSLSLGSETFQTRGESKTKQLSVCCNRNSSSWILEVGKNMTKPHVYNKESEKRCKRRFRSLSVPPIIRMRKTSITLIDHSHRALGSKQRRREPRLKRKSREIRHHLKRYVNLICEGYLTRSTRMRNNSVTKKQGTSKHNSYSSALKFGQNSSALNYSDDSCPSIDCRMVLSCTSSGSDSECNISRSKVKNKPQLKEEHDLRLNLATLLNSHFPEKHEACRVEEIKMPASQNHVINDVTSTTSLSLSCRRRKKLNRSRIQVHNIEPQKNNVLTTEVVKGETDARRLSIQISHIIDIPPSLDTAARRDAYKRLKNCYSQNDLQNNSLKRKTSGLPLLNRNLSSCLTYPSLRNITLDECSDDHRSYMIRSDTRAQGRQHRIADSNVDVKSMVSENRMPLQLSKQDGKSKKMGISLTQFNSERNEEQNQRRQTFIGSSEDSTADDDMEDLNLPECVDDQCLSIDTKSIVLSLEEKTNEKSIHSDENRRPSSSSSSSVPIPTPRRRLKTPNGKVDHKSTANQLEGAAEAIVINLDNSTQSGFVCKDVIDQPYSVNEYINSQSKFVDENSNNSQSKVVDEDTNGQSKVLFEDTTDRSNVFIEDKNAQSKHVNRDVNGQSEVVSDNNNGQSQSIKDDNNVILGLKNLVHQKGCSVSQNSLSMIPDLSRVIKFFSLCEINDIDDLLDCFDNTSSACKTCAQPDQKATSDIKIDSTQLCFTDYAHDATNDLSYSTCQQTEEPKYNNRNRQSVYHYSRSKGDTRDTCKSRSLESVTHLDSTFKLEKDFSKKEGEDERTFTCHTKRRSRVSKSIAKDLDTTGLISVQPTILDDNDCPENIFDECDIDTAHLCNRESKNTLCDEIKSHRSASPTINNTQNEVDSTSTLSDEGLDPDPFDKPTPRNLAEESKGKLLQTNNRSQFKAVKHKRRKKYIYLKPPTRKSRKVRRKYQNVSCSYLSSINGQPNEKEQDTYLDSMSLSSEVFEDESRDTHHKQSKVQNETRQRAHYSYKRKNRQRLDEGRMFQVPYQYQPDAPKKFQTFQDQIKKHENIRTTKMKPMHRSAAAQNLRLDLQDSYSYKRRVLRKGNNSTRNQRHLDLLRKEWNEFQRHNSFFNQATAMNQNMTEQGGQDRKPMKDQWNAKKLGNSYKYLFDDCDVSYEQSEEDGNAATDTDEELRGLIEILCEMVSERRKDCEGEFLEAIRRIFPVSKSKHLQKNLNSSNNNKISDVIMQKNNRFPYEPNDESFSEKSDFVSKESKIQLDKKNSRSPNRKTLPWSRNKQIENSSSQLQRAVSARFIAKTSDTITSRHKNFTEKPPLAPGPQYRDFLRNGKSKSGTVNKSLLFKGQEAKVEKPKCADKKCVCMGLARSNLDLSSDDVKSPSLLATIARESEYSVYERFVDRRKEDSEFGCWNREMGRGTRWSNSLSRNLSCNRIPICTDREYYKQKMVRFHNANQTNLYR